MKRHAISRLTDPPIKDVNILAKAGLNWERIKRRLKPDDVGHVAHFIRKRGADQLAEMVTAMLARVRPGTLETFNSAGERLYRQRKLFRKVMKLELPKEELYRGICITEKSGVTKRKPGDEFRLKMVSGGASFPFGSYAVDMDVAKNFCQCWRPICMLVRLLDKEIDVVLSPPEETEIWFEELLKMHPSFGGRYHRFRTKYPEYVIRAAAPKVALVELVDIRPRPKEQEKPHNTKPKPNTI
jgi:hypothetical protein